MLCLHNMHRFDAVINVVIFENSLSLKSADFTESVWQGLEVP